jgi:hypothetical protein
VQPSDLRSAPARPHQRVGANANVLLAGLSLSSDAVTDSELRLLSQAAGCPYVHVGRDRATASGSRFTVARGHVLDPEALFNAQKTLCASLNLTGLSFDVARVTFTFAVDPSWSHQGGNPLLLYLSNALLEPSEPNYPSPHCTRALFSFRRRVGGFLGR